VSTDLWILVLGIGFFAVCVLYVAFCDRIIGPDDDNLASDVAGGTADADRETAAVGQ
jgi:hypothetical protein